VVAGRELSPEDAKNAKRLHDYWTKNPEGLSKWADTTQPWTNLFRHLLKFLPEDEAKRTASVWFHDVFGFYSGSDLNRVTHGRPPRGRLIGPG
jgi:tRNA U34 5-methylaminomethyl-2-thiouridine-forming methyltransferase MnmC